MKLPGNFAVALLFVLPLSGFTQDPFAAPGASSEVRLKPNNGTDSASLGIGFTAEWIEIDLKTMARLLREHGGDDNSKPIYEAVDALIAEERAERVEVLYGRLRSKERTKIESIDEMIYPTEYDPPEIPNDIVIEKGAENQVPKTSANPTSFETRNIGKTIEIEPVFDPETNLIHLNIAPQIVQFLGRRYHIPDGKVKGDDGIESIWMPRFYTIQYSGLVSVDSGRTTLLATFSPPPKAKKDTRLMLFIHAKALIPKTNTEEAE